MSAELVSVSLASDRSEPSEHCADAQWWTPDEHEAAHLVESLSSNSEKDPLREGLLQTPQRVVQRLRYLTKGYEESLDELVNSAVFTERYSELVAGTDIDFYSLCEHHLLPFFGQAHIGYIPDGRVIGLSKLPRIVDLFARRLQVQERMTEQIADALMRALAPSGVAVVVEGSHLCMMMRGVQRQHSRTVTSSMRGGLLDDPRSRNEFLGLVQARRR